MEKFFYVFDGLNKIGPYSKDEILKMLFSAHISLTDSVFDTRDNVLSPLLQHEDFGGSGAVINSSVNARISGDGMAAPKVDFSGLHTDPLKTNKSTTTKPNVKAPTTGTTPAASMPTSNQATSNSAQINTTTKLMNANNNLNFYVNLNNKEYGPFKFLILLSLYKQNKINLTSPVKVQDSATWGKLSDFIPVDVQKSVHMTPIIGSNVLPKNFWKRKNLRLDYEEMVILTNETYSLVAKSIDLSVEGMAVVWIYDIPLNQEFHISLFDSHKNLTQIKGKLVRRESIPNNDNYPLYKAVFIFSEKLEIKNFIS